MAAAAALRAASRWVLACSLALKTSHPASKPPWDLSGVCTLTELSAPCMDHTALRLLSVCLLKTTPSRSLVCVCES